jgi:hypothetical protein
MQSSWLGRLLARNVCGHAYSLQIRSHGGRSPRRGRLLIFEPWDQRSEKAHLDPCEDQGESDDDCAYEYVCQRSPSNFAPS